MVARGGYSGSTARAKTRSASKAAQAEESSCARGKRSECNAQIESAGEGEKAGNAHDSIVKDLCVQNMGRNFYFYIRDASLFRHQPSGETRTKIGITWRTTTIDYQSLTRNNFEGVKTSDARLKVESETVISSINCNCKDTDSILILRLLIVNK